DLAASGHIAIGVLLLTGDADRHVEAAAEEDEHEDDHDGPCDLLEVAHGGVSLSLAAQHERPRAIDEYEPGPLLPSQKERMTRGAPPLVNGPAAARAGAQNSRKRNRDDARVCVTAIAVRERSQRSTLTPAQSRGHHT